ncbi:glycerate kinase [Bacillus sp. AFS073361]|uniref:glycerate kinase family protein n=1 Tax=Bacillus sp. AFS073361 TaxID=2033511 RepID=UPI000BF5902E|nr:glycerate kinase [Bacillus sp. AFS073361]PFP29221.1 glycerate kinase [Bacillus sp. AFS073361]
MNILIAMDSLKGSLSSIEANKAIKDGFLQTNSDFNIQTVPVADGGEGTVEALVHATKGRFVETTVTGPLGKPVKARYGILGNQVTAVIEIAEACGLPLLKKEKRNPLFTTTFGVGEMILEALDNGCHDFIIGLGGSATNDAGVGMLQALGYQFFNEEGLEVGHGGSELKNITKIVMSSVPEKVRMAKFRVACDVNNPLYGENGAAHIYGPQKGATPEVVRELDGGLQHFSNVVSKQLGTELQQISGAGAAGGLGAAFAGFLEAELESGVQLILEQAQLESKLQEVSFVITGEGKLDGQTSMGKAPAGVALMARKHAVPVIALAGDISEGNSSLHESGITAYFTIVNGPVDLEVAMAPDVTRENLKTTAEQIGRVLSLLEREIDTKAV